MIEENEKWFEKSEEKQSGISISRWIVLLPETRVENVVFVNVKKIEGEKL
jgi:hypothetical protein